MSDYLERAYTMLDVKALDDSRDVVRIKGMATTPSPDRDRDIVDPQGAKFTTPMPLLWMHQHDKPIGEMTFAKAQKNGIPFEAEIPKITEAGTVKDRIDEAIHSLKYNLVKAVSIGFRALEGGAEFMDNGGIHFKDWEWLELSLVTVPANSQAVITAVKSLDQSSLTALGPEREQRFEYRRPTAPSGEGKRVVNLKSYYRR